MATIVYGPLLAIISFTTAAARSGSYLRRDGSSRKVYGPPPAFAVSATMFVVYIVALAFSVPGREALSEVLASWWSGATRQTQIFVLLIGGVSVVSLYMATLQWLRRKRALVLDTRERRYRTIDLSSVIVKLQSGTWDDISGIYVRGNNPRRQSNSSTYFVCLKWRGSSKAYSALGGFEQREQAEAYAKKVAQELRLPVVTAK